MIKNRRSVSRAARLTRWTVVPFIKRSLHIPIMFLNTDYISKKMPTQCVQTTTNVVFLDSIGSIQKHMGKSPPILFVAYPGGGHV